MDKDKEQEEILFSSSLFFPVKDAFTYIEFKQIIFEYQGEFHSTSTIYRHHQGRIITESRRHTRSIDQQ